MTDLAVGRIKATRLVKKGRQLVRVMGDVTIEKGKFVLDMSLSESKFLAEWIIEQQTNEQSSAVK